MSARADFARWHDNLHDAVEHLEIIGFTQYVLSVHILEVRYVLIVRCVKQGSNCLTEYKLIYIFTRDWRW